MGELSPTTAVSSNLSMASGVKILLQANALTTQLIRQNIAIAMARDATGNGFLFDGVA